MCLIRTGVLHLPQKFNTFSKTNFCKKLSKYFYNVMLGKLCEFFSVCMGVNSETRINWGKWASVHLEFTLEPYFKPFYKDMTTGNDTPMG